MRPMLLAILVALGGVGAVPSLGRAADLHLVQRFQIFQNKQPLLQEDRGVYVQGDKLVLENPKQWLLIRADLKKVWLMDRNRQPLVELPLDQFQMNGVSELQDKLAQAQLPPIQPTGQSRTVAGLTCQVHRAATTVMSIEACVTRQLPGLERFGKVLGSPGGLPGVPLEFAVSMEPPGQPPVLIRQTLLKAESGRLDTQLFAEPK